MQYVWVFLEFYCWCWSSQPVFLNFSHSFVYLFLISSNVLSYSLFLYNNNITQHTITCMVTCRCWNAIFILLLFILECFSKPFIIIGVNVCGCECLKMFLSQVRSILALSFSRLCLVMVRVSSEKGLKHIYMWEPSITINKLYYFDYHYGGHW